jgi:hypothetical protein
MADQREIAQTFWDTGLSDAERAHLLTWALPSVDLVRRMADAGLIPIGVRWETSEGLGYTFVMPPALQEILEREQT